MEFPEESDENTLDVVAASVYAFPRWPDSSTVSVLVPLDVDVNAPVMALVVFCTVVLPLRVTVFE